MSDTIEVPVYDGKYTFRWSSSAGVRVDRYMLRDWWIPVTGTNAILALMQHAEGQGARLAAAEAEIQSLRAELAASQPSDGLVFGPYPAGLSTSLERHAVAVDGWPYAIGKHEYGGFWWFGPSAGDTGVRPTEAEAIEAAREHDRKRRGVR